MSYRNLGPPLSIRRVAQKRSYCGLACLEMMFGFLGTSVTQDQIADEIVASTRMTLADLETHGADIDQLGVAANRISADQVLLGKYDSGVDDIASILATERLPVGIEWQSTFIRADRTLFDIGHYSLIRGIDDTRGDLLIVDPDNNSIFAADGILPLKELEGRWWEKDFLAAGPERSSARRERLMFVLANRSGHDRLVSRGLRSAAQLLGRAFPVKEVSDR